MDTIRVYLIDKYGNCQYGLNWGQRDGREANQSYLQLDSEVYNSNFFPKKGTYFLVNTDDSETFVMTRAQKTDDGTAIQTPEKNSILGLYIRKRLGVTEGLEITKEHILDYGRIEMTFKKVDERHFYLDFSKNWKSNDIPLLFKTYILTIKREIPYKTLENHLNKLKSEDTTAFQPLYDEFLNAEFYRSHYSTNIESDDYMIKVSKPIDEPLQQIFYGAPGTGKSDTIYETTKDLPKDDVYRTTFHPDSDYASFVGSYKPTMDDRTVYGAQGPLRNSRGEEIAEPKITYTFCPQAFTNAYVRAWQTDKPVFLMIEEINRGNCAQIFGDLFQLLDRKNNISQYPIDADIDLQKYLQKALADTTRTDIPDNVKSGEKLLLPNNLYIWATMNTSDQSLFPIDSAFKRRWDWKYIKIKKGVDKVTQEPLNWIIKVGEESYDWWEFLKVINSKINGMTSSADKQLGYFFCLADKNEISADTFVNKVAFYLWNDVFKDYAEDGSPLLKYKKNADDKEESDLTFPDFFDEEGKIDNNVVKQFIDNVFKEDKTDNKTE